MLHPVLFLVFAAGAQNPASEPVIVTGHAWAPFISPMGEPFRARTPADDTLASWFRKADRNRDGFLTSDEMEADAERFFAVLDTSTDGEIDPDELAHYEYEIAPEIQVMSRTRRAPGQLQSDDDEGRRAKTRRLAREIDVSLGLGGALQGAARYAILNIPEPVAAADADFDRGVTLSEFKAAAIDRFQMLDSSRQGRLTLTQLQALRPPPPDDRRRRKRNDKVPDRRIGNPLPSQTDSP
jgi:Ca2+-binding EF-hand superfamily protein